MMLHLCQEQALDDKVQNSFGGSIPSNGVLDIFVVDSADDALASERFRNNTGEEAVCEVISNGLKISNVEDASFSIHPLVVHEVNV